MLEIEIIRHLDVFALLSLNLRHLAQLRTDSTLVISNSKSIDNIESVRQEVSHNPKNSVRSRSELQMSKTFLWRVSREGIERSVICTKFSSCRRSVETITRKGFNLRCHLLKSLAGGNNFFSVRRR